MRGGPAGKQGAALTRAQLCRRLDLGLPASSTVRDACLLSLSPRPMVFCTASPTDGDCPQPPADCGSVSLHSDGARTSDPRRLPGLSSSSRGPLNTHCSPPRLGLRKDEAPANAAGCLHPTSALLSPQTDLPQTHLPGPAACPVLMPLWLPLPPEEATPADLTSSAHGGVAQSCPPAFAPAAPSAGTAVPPPLCDGSQLSCHFFQKHPTPSPPPIPHPTASEMSKTIILHDFSPVCKLHANVNHSGVGFSHKNLNSSRAEESLITGAKAPPQSPLWPEPGQKAGAEGRREAGRGEA